MKLLELNLAAYGPFTNTSLQFSTKLPHLNVVYGANEAGKSSALRGLIAFLYGFENQTTDDFVHPYKDLKVGASIELADRTKLILWRRKGQKNTLLDNAGKPVHEDILQPLIGNVNKVFFQNLFGINHHRLRQGGEEILAGGGKIGEALFSAGTGFTDLNKLMQELQAAAEALFKPNGKNQRINLLCRQHSDLRQTVKDQMLRGKDWQSQQQQLELDQDRIAAINQTLQSNQIEHNRLSRILQALPHSARHYQLQQDQSQLASARILPKNFTANRIKAMELLSSARRELAIRQQELARINFELQALNINSQLLDFSTEIQRLFQKSGEFTKANKDSSVLLINAESQEATALEFLREIRSDLTLTQATVELDLSKAQRDGIRELGNQYGSITTDLENAKSRQFSIISDYNRYCAELDSLDLAIDTTALKRICIYVQKFGNLEERIASIETKINRDHIQINFELKKIAGIWSNDLEQLLQLSLPILTTIEQFQEYFTELSAQQRTLSNELKTAKHELAHAVRQLTLLGPDDSIPTEAKLQEARLHRDTGWRLIKKRLIGKPDIIAEQVFTNLNSLEIAYEQSIMMADNIADRLRREAVQVQQQTQAQADYTYYQNIINSLSQELAKIEELRLKKQEDWHDLWASLGIKYGSPKDMHIFLDQVDKIRLKFYNTQESVVELRKLEELHSELLRKLDEQLTLLQQPTTPQETLQVKLERAQAIVTNQEQVQRRRHELESKRQHCIHQTDKNEQLISDLERKLSTWKQQWIKLISILNLDADSTPTQANIALSRIEDMFKALRDAASLRKRIRDIAQDGVIFTAEVAHLCSQIAPDLQSQSPLNAITTLNYRLQEVYGLISKREVLDVNLQEQYKRITEVKLLHDSAKNSLDLCLQEADCTSYEDLAVVEARSAQRTEIENKIAINNNLLIEHSGGKTEIEFLSEIAAENVDTLPSRIESLRQEIEALEVERLDLRQSIGDKTAILRQFEEPSIVALKAEEMEHTLAALRNAGERYIRLKLAIAVLEQQIENYRQLNQTPLLIEASRIFSALTLGSFSRLESTFVNDGKQVLCGYRNHTQALPITVENMSDGTRDQLFLALRIASIKHHFSHTESIPLIADDILVNYDDERSMATLRQLLDLSNHTQIIVFTHHEHITQLATQALGQANCSISNLN
ncbi:hypothetical protein TI04_07700 [Achromatium sp. WMS2]|nr:hypothetical protein TI04_07700 [Achromatium sp. WMS2]